MICWVLYRNEDEPHFLVEPEELVQKRLNDEWEGYTFLAYSDAKVLNLEYFPARSVLIIKGGTAVQPKPVTTVTKFEI